ncbi:SLAP domain-containing protein [Lactobacillus pasteurii]|uniref:Possible surface layer protein n=1 Tax=Lactobacillus pasteurii DSM 23907 = CRBIP 24.76 TaxID=1423790 RepID=I7KLQ8_9LACO|nr:SLAP domain-containing protein [Lactobacillus pasteurii]TDG77509.1 hypothetical protein C5L33_000952 [Lactobacillus pasteurii]CCI85529.1 Possible surface layer protein [Lactobacillus pasteurii DSM 23907 = CRBIP 24.76]
MKGKLILVCASVLGAGLFFNRPVQASSTQTITIAPTYDGKVSVVDKKGNYIGNTNVSSNKSYKYYGRPVVIKGKAHALENALDLITYIGKDTYQSLGDGGFVKAANATSSYEKDGKIYLRINKNSYIYDKNGKRIKNFHGQSYLKAGSDFQYLGKIASTYAPKVLYNIGKGHYVDAQYIAKVDGKGVVRLNHNAYVYDKNGKRVGKTVLGKYSLVKYAGKWQKATKNSVFFTKQAYKSSASYTLPTKKIKNSTYIAIGKNAYVKTINLELLNGRIIFAKGPVELTIKHDQVAIDTKLNPSTKIYHRGQKVTSDYAVSYGSGDVQRIYYHIKGSDYYLDWGPGEEYPNNSVEDQVSANFYIRQHIQTSRYLDKYNTIVDFNKTVSSYDVNGKVIGSLKSGSGVFVADQARYIWNSSENKAELYYHLTARIVEPYGDDESSEPERSSCDLYVKASDADTVTGLKLKAQNTAKEAEADYNKIASKELKNRADTLLAAVDTVKASDKYRLSDYQTRAAYDQALASLTKAKNDSQTTQMVMASLIDQVQISQKRLDGKKIKVKDLNDLSTIEANAIFALMQDVNNYDKIRVGIYTDYATKSGRYPSDFKNSQRSHFVLIDANSKKHDLNVKEYATD